MERTGLQQIIYHTAYLSQFLKHHTEKISLIQQKKI